MKMPVEYDIEAFRTSLNKQTGHRYYADGILGAGNFGVVVKAYDNYLKQTVAVKFLKTEKMHEYLGSEICNHRALRHPHVIRFKRAMDIGGCLAIVMEFANGSNLTREIRSQGRLMEPVARWIFQQLILAVDYCHKKGIASRDIKCDNILLVRGQKLPIAKLSDFGYSVHRKTVAKSIVGTTDYMAPEVITAGNGKGYDARKADIWSCGVVLYKMLAGSYPFSSRQTSYMDQDDREPIKGKILSLEYSVPMHFSLSVSSLVQRMLSRVEERCTIEEILKDPWFLKNLPEEAKTMNDEILRSEKKRRLGKSSSDFQTDEQINDMIKRASKERRNLLVRYELEKPDTEVITDSVIDAEFDQYNIEHKIAS